MPKRRPLTGERRIVVAYITLNRNEGQTILRTAKLPREETELPDEKVSARGQVYETERKVPPWANEPYFKPETSTKEKRTLTELFDFPINKRNLTALLGLVCDSIEQVVTDEKTRKEIQEILQSGSIRTMVVRAKDVSQSRKRKCLVWYTVVTHRIQGKSYRYKVKRWYSSERYANGRRKVKQKRI